MRMLKTKLWNNKHTPVQVSPQPGCSGIHRPRNIQKPHSSPPARSRNYQELSRPEKHKQAEQEITPGKALDQISPVPKVTPGLRKVRANLESVASLHRKKETGRSKEKENVCDNYKAEDNKGPQTFAKC